MRSTIGKRAIALANCRHARFLANSASSSSASTSVSSSPSSSSQSTLALPSSSYASPFAKELSRYPNAQLVPQNNTNWLRHARQTAQQKKLEQLESKPKTMDEQFEAKFEKITQQIDRARRSKVAPDPKLPVNWHMLEIGLLSIYIPTTRIKYRQYHAGLLGKLAAHFKLLAWPLVIYPKKLIMDVPVKFFKAIASPFKTYKAFRARSSSNPTHSGQSTYELNGREYYNFIFVALRSRMYSFLSLPYVLSKDGSKLPWIKAISSRKSRTKSLASELAKSYQTILKAQFSLDHKLLQNLTCTSFGRSLLKDMALRKLKSESFQISLLKEPQIICSRYFYQPEGPDGSPSHISQIALRVITEQQIKPPKGKIVKKTILQYPIFQRRDDENWKLLTFAHEDEFNV